MADDKLVVTDELIGTVAAKVSEIIDKKAEKPSQKIPEFSDTKLQDKFENTYRIWVNNGYDNYRDQFNPMKKDQRIGFKELCDALSTPDASILLGHVVSNIVKEAMEPLLVGTSLLHTIRFSAGQQITFPAAGAFSAEDERLSSWIVISRKNKLLTSVKSQWDNTEGYNLMPCRDCDIIVAMGMNIDSHNTQFSYEDTYYET